jgi:hypothetical protein
MSKKPDTASALAGILRAKRGDESDVEPTPPAAIAPVVIVPTPPSPALPPAPPVAITSPAIPDKKTRGGKSSNKATFSQFSVYLRKDTRKKVGRALEDAETGQDFSDLVQSLLEQWLTSRT